MRTMKHIVKLFALSDIHTINNKLTVHIGQLDVDELYGQPIFQDVVLGDDGNFYRTGSYNVDLIPLYQWEIDEIVWDW